MAERGRLPTEDSPHPTAEEMEALHRLHFAREFRDIIDEALAFGVPWRTSQDDWERRLASLAVSDREKQELRGLAALKTELLASKGVRDGLRAVRSEHAVSGKNWLDALLAEAVSVAGREGHRDLARVLSALHASTAKGDFEMVGTDLGKRYRTMLASANAYLDAQDRTLVGARRQAMSKVLAKAFFRSEPDLTRMEERLETICEMLGSGLYTHMVNAYGPPRTDDWQEAVKAEITERRNWGDGKRDPREYRMHVHYVRAVLRGWGLSGQEADDATEGVGFETP